MDKKIYLEQVKRQYCVESAAEQTVNRYWLESQSVNEVFQLAENDESIPVELYISWKESYSKSWEDVCSRIKLDNEAKSFLINYYGSEKNEIFNESLWGSTVKRCLFDRTIKPSDFISIVFAYQHLKNQQEIDIKIEPIKNLLIDLEKIIGSECFNINKAEPWRRWGVLDPTCERLRYPITFETGNERTIKVHDVPDSISNMDFISGKYVFGGNQLDIFRGLYKVLKHLKASGLLHESVDLR